MNSLELCPFCGGKAKVNKCSNLIPPNFEQFIGYIVSCGSCGAKSAWKETKSEAIKQWNTRKESNENRN